MHHSFLRPGTAVHIPATPQREDHESRGSLADSPRGTSPVEPHIFARGSAALFRFRKWMRCCKELAPCSRGRSLQESGNTENIGFDKKLKKQKTRCSPRTRMLTRMLMVQMSKHMEMQSCATLFCNSLFEQSRTYFPCYQSAVWIGKCRV